MERKHKIEFSVTCTAEEHEKAWFAVQYACDVLRFWPLIVLCSLLPVAAASYAVMVEGEAVTNPLVVTFCILTITLPIVYFTYVILYVNKRRRYYTEKYLSVGERELTVFAHSVSVRSKMLSTDVPFEDCVRLINKKDFFVLVQSRRGYLIIPKRDVPADEMKELKKRLRLCSATYRLFHRG